MRSFVLLILLISFGIAFFILPHIGPHYEQRISSVLENRIIWQHRFPRMLLGMIAGSGLALAGLAFQTMFRNPLATPYTLGVSSGASFGAVLFLHIQAIIGISWKASYSLSTAAFLGASLAMSVVYLLSSSKRRTDEQMLLAGVAVNFFFSGLVLFMQYASDPANAMRMFRWTLGGLTDSSYADIYWLTPIVLAYFGFLYYFSREFDVLLLGGDRAIALGMNVHRFRVLIFFSTSILIASIVAVCGPIGFVGLMIPHLCRLVIGNEHRFLIPATFLSGALFLAACDAFSRTIVTSGELPVSILTSLLGGPFFLWLLLREGNKA